MFGNRKVTGNKIQRLRVVGDCVHFVFHCEPLGRQGSMSHVEGHTLHETVLCSHLVRKKLFRFVIAEKD